MAWPYRYETGVAHYDRDRAFTGYTLVTPFPGRSASAPNEDKGEVFLIDMTGQVVHSWKAPFPVWYARLMPDGHLVTAQRRATPELPDRPGFDAYHMGGAHGQLMELDWDSTILFEHFDPNMHHDFRRLENGNYIYVG